MLTTPIKATFCYYVMIFERQNGDMYVSKYLSNFVEITTNVLTVEKSVKYVYWWDFLNMINLYLL